MTRNEVTFSDSYGHKNDDGSWVDCGCMGERKCREHRQSPQHTPQCMYEKPDPTCPACVQSPLQECEAVVTFPRGDGGDHQLETDACDEQIAALVREREELRTERDAMRALLGGYPQMTDAEAIEAAGQIAAMLFTEQGARRA